MGSRSCLAAKASRVPLDYGRNGDERPSPRPAGPAAAPETGTSPMTDSRGLSRLLDIMARLRDPQRGCPWDLEQTFATIAPYTIEEASEVAEAAERGESEALNDDRS